MSHGYHTRSKEYPLTYKDFQAQAHSTQQFSEVNSGNSPEDTLSDPEEYSVRHRTVITTNPETPSDLNLSLEFLTPRCEIDILHASSQRSDTVNTLIPSPTPAIQTQNTVIMAQNITLRDAINTNTEPLLPKFRAPPSFDPLTDNPILFLQSYDRVAAYNGWTDTNKLRLFGTYLRGSAQDWLEEYKALQGNLTKTWEDVKVDFLDQFNGDDALEDLREQLDSRKQKDHESPLEYFNEIYKLCKTVDKSMPETEMNRILKRGLKPKYQTLLIQMGKKSNTTQELQELMKKFQKLDLLETQATSSAKRPTTPVLAVTTKAQDTYEAIFNTRAHDGRPRCYNCNRVGHGFRSCPQPLNNRFRQPPSPPRNRSQPQHQSKWRSNNNNSRRNFSQNNNRSFSPSGNNPRNSSNNNYPNSGTNYQNNSYQRGNPNFNSGNSNSNGQGRVHFQRDPNRMASQSPQYQNRSRSSTPTRSSNMWRS